MGNSTELFLSCQKHCGSVPSCGCTGLGITLCLQWASASVRAQAGVAPRLTYLDFCPVRCPARPGSCEAPCATRDDTLGTSWEESGLPLPSGLSLPPPSPKEDMRSLRKWIHIYAWLRPLAVHLETITTLFIGSCCLATELFGSPLERSTVSVRGCPAAGSGCAGTVKPVGHHPWRSASALPSPC